jgi:hypothetical protein
VERVERECGLKGEADIRELKDAQRQATEMRARVEHMEKDLELYRSEKRKSDE